MLQYLLSYCVTGLLLDQNPAAAADSEVNLNAATGPLRWYYQAVPDDFEDHDLQASPIAAEIAGAPVIITGGKMGDVYALSAQTGALLWKTPVGERPEEAGVGRRGSPQLVAYTVP